MNNYVVVKTEYLIHHGTKGQRWGVRNGPPYPIENKVLAKGTRLNSISSKYVTSDAYKKNGRWMYTYRQDEKWDNKVYKGPFSKYQILMGARFLREHEFETTEDLRMPNSNERFSEFKQMCEDPKTKRMVINDIESCRKQLVAQNVGNEQERKDYTSFNPEKMKTANDYKIAYNIFNHAMEAVHYRESTREYARRISQKYDAMVDDNNVNIYNKAHDPIIIFNADKWLKDVSDPKSPKFLTMQEVAKNYIEVRDELEKQGIRTKL